MKKLITDMMTTTAIPLIALSLFVRVRGFDLYFSRTVLVAFGANVVIHLGLLLTRKFESKYLALEVLLDVVYTTTVLIVFGFAFSIFNSIPIPILIAMAVLTHVIALFLNMARFKEDANTINKLIKNRDARRKAAGAKKVTKGSGN